MSVAQQSLLQGADSVPKTSPSGVSWGIITQIPFICFPTERLKLVALRGCTFAPTFGAFANGLAFGFVVGPTFLGLLIPIAQNPPSISRCISLIHLLVLHER